MGRFLKYSLLLFCLSGFAVLVIPYIVPWTTLNCRRENVDIMTGRIRFSRYLGFCKISGHVEETALSEVLSPEEM
jgi:hypothetical protein